MTNEEKQIDRILDRLIARIKRGTSGGKADTRKQILILIKELGYRKVSDKLLSDEEIRALQRGMPMRSTDFNTIKRCLKAQRDLIIKG